MNINSAFPSTYLKASDLPPGGVVVTIDRVEIEPIGRDKELKPCIYFVGKEKGVVLNKTNSKKIMELVGSPDTEEWAGIQITLYPTETEFSGETVECIRVKSAAPPRVARSAAPARTPARATRPVAEPELDAEEIPF